MDAVPTGYLYDPVFLEHTNASHPENRARLEAVMALLNQTKQTDKLLHIPFAPATMEQLRRVQDPAYLFALRHFAERGGGMVDLNTYANAATYRSTVAAVGASIAAANAVLDGDVQRAFALVRPPGHHAHADRADGFCIMNNAAFVARQALGDIDPRPSTVVERVMIVDFDVHHGNGTQEIFYLDPRVFYISMHQWPLFPGTGHIDEVGKGAAVGTNANIPLPPDAGDQVYTQVCDEIIAPLARRFRPGLFVVSAGYDAHWLDQLASMKVSLAGFSYILRVLVDLSNELCAGRMAVVLEGGYDLDVLSHGVLNTFHALREEYDQVRDPFGAYPGHVVTAQKVIDKVKQINHL